MKFLKHFINSKWNELGAEQKNEITKFLLDKSNQWSENNENIPNLNSLYEAISLVFFYDFPSRWNSPISDVLQLSQNSVSYCLNSLHIISSFFDIFHSKKSIPFSFRKSFEDYLSSISQQLIQMFISFLNFPEAQINTLEVLCSVVRYTPIQNIIQSQIFDFLLHIENPDLIQKIILILNRFGKNYLALSFEKRDDYRLSIYSIYENFFNFLLTSSQTFYSTTLKAMSIFMKISRNERLPIHQQILQFALQLTRNLNTSFIASLCSFWTTGYSQVGYFGYASNFWFLMKFEINCEEILRLFIPQMKDYIERIKIQDFWGVEVKFTFCKKLRISLSAKIIDTIFFFILL